MSSVLSFAPPVPIDGPPPVAPPFNLWTVARDVSEPRAPGGMNVLPYPCATPEGWVPCPPGSDREKLVNPPDEMPLFNGFTAYIASSCTRSALGSDEEFRRKLATVLDNTDHLAAEQQLAFGAFQDLNPYLDDADATPLGGGGDPVEVLGLLEAAIRETGRMGVIHAPGDLVAAWGFDRVRDSGDGVLRTVLGTPIVAGSGYGTGTAWATGPVLYERGPVDVVPGTRAQATDRSSNEVAYYAEREIVVGWDGCLHASVDYSLT